MRFNSIIISIAASITLAACCGNEGTDVLIYISNGDTTDIGVFGELYGEPFSIDLFSPGNTVDINYHINSEEVIRPDVQSEFECYYYNSVDTIDISQLNKYSEHKGQEDCYKYISYSILIW